MSEDATTTNIGLAENPKGVEFHCEDCVHFDADEGRCYKKLPDSHLGAKLLYKRLVEPDYCCNFFWHSGMKVLIK